MTTTRKQSRPALTIESLDDRRVFAVGYSLIDLGGLPGLAQPQSSAVSINEAGDIAGNSYTAGPTATGTSRHPVVWHREAGGTYQITDLGFPTAPNVAAKGFALDINNQGDVLGTASTDVGSYIFLVRPEDANGDGRPDRWFRDANSDGLNDLMINLTALNNQINNIGANAINGRGQIVGSYGLAQFDASGTQERGRMFAITATSFFAGIQPHSERQPITDLVDRHQRLLDVKGSRAEGP